jgi:hypothetical protein
MVSLARFTFFRENAGGWVGHAAETAIRLARAEVRADALGLEVRFADEDLPWDGDCPAPSIHVYAWVEDQSGRKRAHLGLIGLESWNDSYVRVVSAELLADALDEIDDEDDAFWTREACLLGDRATFAGVML